MQCPKCGSENTQRLQVVHEQGTQVINTTSNTVGTGLNASPFASLGLAGAQTKTTGTAQSATAKKAAPPAQYPAYSNLVLSLLGVFCLAAEWWIVKIAGVAMIAGGVYAVYWAKSYNREKWPALYARWEASWLCSKCGTIYEQKLS
jgi:predicted RNA-binding Zn-ribbon protein involved in translation (DUF1610 family)